MRALTSRRAALGGLSAVVGALGRPVAAHSARPDAELLGLCARWHRIQAYLESVVLEDDERTAGLDDREVVSDKIEAIHAATPDGIRAKASVAFALLQEARRADDMDSDVRFAMETLREIMG